MLLWNGRCACNLNRPIRIQQAGKTVLSWRQCTLTGKACIEFGQLLSLETALNIHEKGFIISKTILDCIMWKKFRTKYAVPCQIKRRIPESSIKRGQSNLNIVFAFVSCEEKNYFRVVSLEQLGFDWRTFRRRSRRMHIRKRLDLGAKAPHVRLYRIPTVPLPPPLTGGGPLPPFWMGECFFKARLS